MQGNLDLRFKLSDGSGKDAVLYPRPGQPFRLKVTAYIRGSEGPPVIAKIFSARGVNRDAIMNQPIVFEETGIRLLLSPVFQRNSEAEEWKKKIEEELALVLKERDEFFAVPEAKTMSLKILPQNESGSEGEEVIFFSVKVEYKRYYNGEYGALFSEGKVCYPLNPSSELKTRAMRAKYIWDNYPEYLQGAHVSNESLDGLEDKMEEAWKRFRNLVFSSVDLPGIFLVE